MFNFADARILVISVVYAALGMVLLYLGYRLFDWLTPTNLQDDIFKNGNVAVASWSGRSSSVWPSSSARPSTAEAGGAAHASVPGLSQLRRAAANRKRLHHLPGMPVLRPIALRA